MKVAFIIYPRITWLDMVGVYDPVTRLRLYKYIPDLSWDICALEEEVTDDFGLTVKPTKVGGDLSAYDAIIVPGGWGTRALVDDERFINWLRTATPQSWKISICTGSLLLGKAGFLEGRKATTHFDEYGTLKPFCGEVVEQRVVRDGHVITAGAVSSSLDLGLYLCRTWASDEADIMIRYKMDYKG